LGTFDTEQSIDCLIKRLLTVAAILSWPARASAIWYEADFK